MGYDLQWTRDESTRGYHRLNIHGMHVLRELLYGLGVLEKASRPKWRPGLTPGQSESILRFRSRFRGKVPYAKFASNDGWLVHAAECRLIAGAIERGGKRIMDAFETFGMHPSDAKMWRRELKEFARYCRRCADAGGFRVT